MRLINRGISEIYILNVRIVNLLPPAGHMDWSFRRTRTLEREIKPVKQENKTITKTKWLKRNIFNAGNRRNFKII